MKYTSILAITLLLTGCYQKVDRSDINTAEKFCRDAGGINYIKADLLGEEKIFCMNGKSKMADTLKLHYIKENK